MSVNIEDILLLKSQQHAANREDNGLAIAAGATALGAAGLVGGHNAQVATREKLLKNLAKETVIPYAPKGLPPGTRLKPGHRMAGGLVGLITGGALGAGVQQAAMAESPAARLLAKVQVGRDLTAVEAAELEDVLTGTYNSIIGA